MSIRNMTGVRKLNTDLDDPKTLSALELAMSDFAGVATYEAKLGYTVTLDVRYTTVTRRWYATARWADAQYFGNPPEPIRAMAVSMTEAIVELVGRLACRNTSDGAHADRFVTR